MKLLVVGASGNVGGEVSSRAKLRGHTVIGAGRHAEGEATRVLDLTSRPDVERAVDELQPDAIFICSAYPYVDGCEKEPERSQRENVGTVANAIAATRGSQARVVYYSTDHVFDGSKPQFVESDPTHPLSVYARHKREAELLLLERGRSLVVRTAWVFGTELRKKNFAYFVIGKARSGSPITVPNKQAGCPTWSRWLADSTLELFEQGMDGVLHLTGNELLSKADWARLLLKSLRLPEVPVSEVSNAEAGQVAPRPASVRLVSERHRLQHPPLKTILETERERLVSG